MTILPHNYDEKGIVTAQQFLEYLKTLDAISDQKAPDYLIISYAEKFFDQVVEKYGEERLEKYSFGGELYYLKDTNKKIAIIGKFGVGAPVATNILEETVARGVKKFISVGTSGGLQKEVDVPLGSLIVCERAIRDEGTSLHYLPASKYSYANTQLTKKIKQQREKEEIEYIAGTSWTTDAIFRETLSKVQQYQKEGVLVVEMEAAALFAVAEFLGVELASIFTISDILGDLKRNPKIHHEETYEKLQKIYETIIKVCK